VAAWAEITKKLVVLVSQLVFVFILQHVAVTALYINVIVDHIHPSQFVTRTFQAAGLQAVLCFHKAAAADLLVIKQAFGDIMKVAL
jgi:hypothetical protein